MVYFTDPETRLHNPSKAEVKEGWMLTRTTRRLLLVPVEDAGTLALLSVVTEDTESPFKVRRLVVSSPRGHSHPWPLRALSVVPCRRLPLEIPAPLPLSRHDCCLAIDITTAIATAITAGAVTIATAITTAAVTIATTTTTTITTAAATVSAT